VLLRPVSRSPAMDMLLPKGIVENTSEIYAEVAGYPVVPPEKICEYWNGSPDMPPLTPQSLG